MKVTDKYVFFWDGEYSQWHPCTFQENGVKYNCAEQYMMYHKAMTFNDTEVAAKVMEMTHPRDQKDLGRAIRNYVNDVWAAVRFDIVVQGNYLKFSQNSDLLTLLLYDHSGKIFVEASPSDTIWGIGLHESYEHIEDESKWMGQNLLGKAINKAREIILSSK